MKFGSEFQRYFINISYIVQQKELEEALTKLVNRSILTAGDAGCRLQVAGTRFVRVRVTQTDSASIEELAECLTVNSLQYIIRGWKGCLLDPRLFTEKGFDRKRRKKPAKVHILTEEVQHNRVII